MNHGDEWGLTWYLGWGIYTSIPTWIHSQMSLALAETPSLKISSHGTFLKWSWRQSQSAQGQSQAMQWNGASCCEFDGRSMETETTTWSEFHSGGKAIVEQILVSLERNKSKRAGLWEWQSGIHVEKLTIWVRSFQINLKNYKSSPGRSVLPEEVSQSLWWTLKSLKTKNISRWVDQENLIYDRWNRIKNCAQRQRRWLIEEKEVRHWVK